MSSNSSSNRSSISTRSLESTFFWWLERVVNVLFPAIMAAYFGTRIWATIEVYAWRRLLRACQESNKLTPEASHAICAPGHAYIVLTMEFFSTLFVVVPWYYCMAVAHIRGRWFTKAPVGGRSQQFQQIDWDSGLVRICHQCPGHPITPIRWYHASGLGINKCLPLFDHHCPWLGAPVYLDNFKAYVLAVTLLPFHFLTTLVFSILGLREHPHDHFTARLVLLFLASIVLSMPVAIWTTIRVWLEILWMNRLMTERDGVGIRIYPDPFNAHDYQDVVYEPESDTTTFRRPSPFNRGMLANMRSLLGWSGSWLKAPAWVFLEPPVGRWIKRDEAHADLWEQLLHRERDRLVSRRRGEKRDEQGTALDGAAAGGGESRPGRPEAARVMSSALRRRANLGSDDYELGVV